MYHNLVQSAPDINELDVSVRGTGDTLNPRTNGTLDSSTRYVYCLYKNGRTRITRVVTTDTPPRSWRLGTAVNLYDPSGKALGRYMIVGLRDSQLDEVVGDVPDRNDIKWSTITRVW
jgi:hypothetical protein